MRYLPRASRCVLWLVAALGLWPPDAAALTQATIERCAKGAQDVACSVIGVRRRNVAIYSEPRSESKVVGHLTWGASGVAGVDWKKSEAGPGGWVFVQGQGRAAGWVEARNLASLDEYRRVVGCWPFEYVGTEVGDARIQVYVDANGTARTEWEEGNGFVWFTDNLVRIGPRLEVLWVDFAFDPSTGETYSHEDPNLAARTRPDEELKGCKGRLKLGKAQAEPGERHRE